MRDFTQLHTDEQLKLLEPHLHKSVSSEGIEGYYKLDLGFSQFTGKIPLYMIIPKESPNPERTLEFLTFARGKYHLVQSKP